MTEHDAVNSRPGLSKTRFVAGTQFHLRLWYDTYARELAPPFVTAQDITVSEARVRSDVVTIACLLGREIARQQLERRKAVDDHAPARELGDREVR